MKTLSATGTLVRARSTAPNPLVLWHLLSLDAPTVATVWMIFVARVERVALPACVVCAMFVAVWAIYAADRLLDARGQRNLEPRHRFHGRYRVGFGIAVAIALVLLVPLVISIPKPLRAGYFALAALLLIWLALIHLLRLPLRLPKEIVVGLFFSAAIFLPALSQATAARLILPVLFFANLCSLNCLFIYAWEHPSRGNGRPHATTSFGLRRLREIAVASIGLPFSAMLFAGAHPILLAAGLAATALLLLHRNRTHMDRTSLRAAADLALLSPLLLLPFLR